jgi:stage V sporulation protein B
MSKNLSVKRTIFTGTLLLTSAGILSRFIGFFYKIFLSRVIGAEGLGIYQLIFPVMALCFSLTSAGIQTAISKFVSKEIGNENPAGARLYLLVGLILSVSLSILTGIYMWNYSEFIAGSFLREMRCAPLIRILSFCYIPCSIHSCINGYYYGLKKTLVPSLSQLAEQSARVGGVYLIYMIAQSNGHSITISDAVWGLVLGEIAGMLVSLSCIGFGACKGNIRKTTWSLLTLSFPLTVNRLTFNLFTAIENLLIPYQLKLFGYSSSDALSIYGILTGMAFAIIMFPTVLTNSISVLLLPIVSEAQAKHNDTLIRKAIIRTTESCLLLGLLCMIGLLLLGDFIGNFIFKNALSATFIVTLSWICPFLYLGSTLNSIFHGLGKPGITLFLNLISCIIRILFIVFLIPVMGIRGYLTGLLVSQILHCVLALLWLYRLMKQTDHALQSV